MISNSPGTGYSLVWLKEGPSSLTVAARCRRSLSRGVTPLLPSKFPLIDLELDGPDEPVEAAVDAIASLDSERVYLAIDHDKWHSRRCANALLVLAQTGDHRWMCFGPEYLDFWSLGWFGERHYIPARYRFLRLLLECGRLRGQVRGLYLNRRSMQALLSEQVYPAPIVTRSLNQALTKGYDPMRYWPEDLIDIYWQQTNAATLYRTWYGPWFITIQGAFRETLAESSGDAVGAPQENLAR